VLLAPAGVGHAKATGLLTLEVACLTNPDILIVPITLTSLEIVLSIDSISLATLLQVALPPRR
jgi:hypothetical protein